MTLAKELGLSEEYRVAVVPSVPPSLKIDKGNHGVDIRLDAAEGFNTPEWRKNVLLPALASLEITINPERYAAAARAKWAAQIEAIKAGS